MSKKQFSKLKKSKKKNEKEMLLEEINTLISEIGEAKALSVLQIAKSLKR